MHHFLVWTTDDQIIFDVCKTFRPRGIFTVTWESCSGPNRHGMLSAIGQRDKTCNQKAWNEGDKGSIREAVVRHKGQMLIFCFAKMRGHIRTYNLAENPLTKWKLGSTEPGEQWRFIADLDSRYELQCTTRRVAGMVTVRRSLCLLILNTMCF